MGPARCPHPLITSNVLGTVHYEVLDHTRLEHQLYVREVERQLIGEKVRRNYPWLSVDGVLLMARQGPKSKRVRNTFAGRICLESHITPHLAHHLDCHLWLYRALELVQESPNTLVAVSGATLKFIILVI